MDRINDFIKMNGITGNTILDSMIISTMIPIIFAYINTLMELFKNIMSKLFYLIVYLIKNKIKDKLNGKIICSVSIDENNTELFNLINEKIFESDIKSDVNNIKIFNSIKFLNNVEDDEKFYYYMNDIDDYELKITRDKSKNLNLSKNNKKFFNNEDKIFYHKNVYFYFKKTTIKSKKDEDNSENYIKIKVISKETYLDSHKILNDFLNIRFNIMSNIPYIYHININSFFIDDIKKHFFIFRNLNKAILIYHTDEYNADSDISNMMSLDINATLSKNIEDYSDYMKIRYKNNNNKLEKDKESFHYLYKKYISHTMPEFRYYGYYINNDILIMIMITREDEMHLNIISKNNILNENDIKNEINFIIKKTNENKIDSLKKKNNICLYKRYKNEWKAYFLDKRDFSTVYLPHDTISQIKKEIEEFKSMDEYYQKFQIPYRKGILLYGPPGTGKMSLAKAIAYEYLMNIYLININDNEINDDSIIEIINSIPANNILLFEDIDSSFACKESIKNQEKKITEKITIEDTVVNTEERKYLTYSGLLNALDGMLSSNNGLLTIMTTNYIEKLGNALIRPGRIDSMFELKECNEEQIISILNNFIDIKLKMDMDENHKKYLNKKYLDNYINRIVKKLIDENGNTKIKPCEFQIFLMKNIKNIDLIYENIDLIKK